MKNRGGVTCKGYAYQIVMVRHGTMQSELVKEARMRNVSRECNFFFQQH